MSQPSAIKKQVSGARAANAARRKRNGMEMVVYDRQHASTFTTTGGSVSRCPHCRRHFTKGDLAFVSKDLTIVIHAKCVLELSQFCIEGASSIPEAELIMERRRIEETGAFYG